MLQQGTTHSFMWQTKEKCTGNTVADSESVIIMLFAIEQSKDY